MFPPPDILDLAARIITLYTRQRWKIVTAESCTGGLLAGALTSVAGASAVFERGFVTYSNDSKSDLLGIPPENLERFGAVSGEVAELMAQGAQARAKADVALGITGFAGPDTTSPAAPLGLVYIGLATRNDAVFHVRYHFSGNRETVRTQATYEALRLLASVTED